VNWTELELRVYEDARKTFADLQQTHPNDVFYAYALYTDGDGITVCAAANSRRGLAKALEQAEVEPGSADAAYYEWATAEWAYEGWDGWSFRDVCTTLRESSASFDVAEVFGIMQRALARVRDDGIFRALPDGEAPVLFVTVSDDDRAEEIENASAKVLNDPETFARFAAR
jgi:hypothetical protein